MYTVGNNDYGQLGNRSHVGSSTPVRVNALDLHKVTHAAYGQNHCLAITEQVCEGVRGGGAGPVQGHTCSLWP